MHEMSPTITLEECAGLLGCQPRTFRNKLPGLLGQGFPRRLPGTGVWSRALVLAWIDSGGAPAFTLGEAAQAPDVLAAYRDMLERRTLKTGQRP